MRCVRRAALRRRLPACLLPSSCLFWLTRHYPACCLTALLPSCTALFLAPDDGPCVLTRLNCLPSHFNLPNTATPAYFLGGGRVLAHACLPPHASACRPTPAFLAAFTCTSAVLYWLECLGWMRAGTGGWDDLTPSIVPYRQGRVAPKTPPRAYHNLP